MTKWILELPWGVRFPGVSYDSKLKVAYYEGDRLPGFLSFFKVPAFSYGEWVQEQLNRRNVVHERGPSTFIPKPHQVIGAKRIAAMHQRGWSGFLLADHTGTGKTLTSLAGLTLAAKTAGFTKSNRAKVLIVAPKGVLPVWRHTIAAYIGSLNYLKPLVINYQQLQKLLKVTEPAPSKAKAPAKGKTKRKVKKTRQVARDGKPIIDFDFIVFDESQYLKNYPSSNVSLAAEKLAKLDKPYKVGSSPYTIFSSATPGSTPLNFAVMSGFMAKLLKPGLTKYIAPKDWGAFLIELGFDVKKGKNGYLWATMPWNTKDKTPAEKIAYEKDVAAAKASQRKDTKRIGDALTRPDAPFIMRSPKNIAGWPEQQLIALPLELDAQERQFYQQAWTQFRTWLRLTPSHKDPKGALVENLRYRQKTSLLRIPSLVERTVEWIEDDKQVYISLEFIESLEKLQEALEKKKISVVEISGRNAAEREQQRLKFQRGQAQVALCTVVAGISLHAGETLPDGTKATNAERITVLADIRQNPLDSLQALGRAHRDGQNSLAFIPYIEDSVDNKVVERFINKVINTEVMTGKSLEEAQELEELFRAAALEDSEED